LPIEYSKPTFLAEKGSEFLERNRSRPFILYLSLLQPHTPNFGPLDGLHRPQDVVLAPSVNAPLGADAPLRYRLLRTVFGQRTKTEWQEEIAKYWGMVAQVDRCVGAVLKQLTALGLAHNTIVVFTSEHGKQMGEHGLWYKNVMYESSVRVPWLIKAPGIHPRVIDSAVSQIDLVPTLLELMGKRPVPSLPGRSLVPVMQGAARHHGDVFLEWNPATRRQVVRAPGGSSQEEAERARAEHTRAVITQNGWKLCLSDVDRGQLFHLQHDPYESHNLLDRESHGDQVQRLAEKIVAWQRATGDPVKVH
jgi:arylsulfatase A-like enzyme